MYKIDALNYSHPIHCISSLQCATSLQHVRSQNFGVVNYEVAVWLVSNFFWMKNWASSLISALLGTIYYETSVYIRKFTHKFRTFLILGYTKTTLYTGSVVQCFRLHAVSNTDNRLSIVLMFVELFFVNKCIILS